MRNRIEKAKLRFSYDEVDPKPAFVHMEEEDSIAQMVAKYVRMEMSAIAAEEGYETFDEANDVEVDGLFADDMGETAYQMDDEPLVEAPTIEGTNPPSEAPPEDPLKEGQESPSRAQDGPRVAGSDPSPLPQGKQT